MTTLLRGTPPWAQAPSAIECHRLWSNASPTSMGCRPQSCLPNTAAGTCGTMRGGVENSDEPNMNIDSSSIAAFMNGTLDDFTPEYTHP